MRGEEKKFKVALRYIASLRPSWAERRRGREREREKRNSKVAEQAKALKGWFSEGKPLNLHKIGRRKPSP